MCHVLGATDTLTLHYFAQVHVLGLPLKALASMPCVLVVPAHVCKSDIKVAMLSLYYIILYHIIVCCQGMPCVLVVPAHVCKSDIKVAIFKYKLYYITL